MRGEVATFLLAVQFLTRLPIRSTELYSEDRMAASVRYYPLVGVLVGSVCAAFYAAASFVLPSYMAVLLAIAVGLLLTGAFHEDGLADTYDGIGGGLTREKSLEIMKDSRLGTYGTLALVVMLSLKAGSLIALEAEFVVAALIAGHGLSRLSSVLVIATSSYVRDHGTGKPVAGGLSIASLVVVLMTGVIVALVWCFVFSPLSLLFAVLGVMIGHILMRLFFERKLGGYTGDTLGTVQQASEVGFYLGLAAWV
ncbi:MAG: adenosylcobinamide-GDP ribazoletransferase [Pseudomonadota bacterium]